jgi:hypothetical protein
LKRKDEMLKKIKIFLMILIVGLICTGIAKDKIFDTPENAYKKLGFFADQNNLDTNIFGISRVLTFKLYYWSLIPMGELRFVTNASRQDTIFSAEALSKGSFVGNFITASARIESHFSKKDDLLPYKYVETTNVKGIIKTKEVLYDRQALLSIRGKKKTRISKDTYDPLGAFIHMLALPLETGESSDILFISGGDLYNLRAALLKEGPRIMEVLVDIKRQNLTSSHGGTLHVWVSNDDRRIPLAFKSWTPAGYASAILNKVEEGGTAI